jgi:hypothetical protein
MYRARVVFESLECFLPIANVRQLVEQELRDDAGNALRIIKQLGDSGILD